MDTRHGAFTLRVDCPACGLPVPLNAPMERATCHACTKDFAVPPRVFGELLRHFDDHPASAAPYDAGAKPIIDGMQVHATAASKEAACEKCGAPLVAKALDVDAPEIFACACGAEAARFPAPAWVVDLVPTARHVIVTDPSAMPGAATEPAANASHPIALPCTQCGAPLHVTSESERTVPCEFCKTDVYLPDDLWRRLHPVKTMAPWFVRFEGTSRAALEDARTRARVDAEAVEREKAQAIADEARLDALVLQKAKSAKARAGCMRVLMALGAVALLGVLLVAKLSGGKGPATPWVRGADPEQVARTTLAISPAALSQIFFGKRTEQYYSGGELVPESGWLSPRHPCNGTVCIDLDSKVVGRVEVFWTARHMDHPSGFSLAAQPGHSLLDAAARRKLGDRLPGGLDLSGRWARYSDRELLLDLDEGGEVRVRITDDDEKNPAWRTQFVAAWKLVMGAVLEVALAPTAEELRALTEPLPSAASAPRQAR